MALNLPGHHNADTPYSNKEPRENFLDVNLPTFNGRSSSFKHSKNHSIIAYDSNFENSKTFSVVRTAYLPQHASEKEKRIYEFLNLKCVF